jgi:hypothetical protein
MINYTYNTFFREFQNNNYKIFDNLNTNLDSILQIYNNDKDNEKINNDFNDNNEYFLMINAFSFKNSGHDFSIILDQINYVIQNNIKNILIYEGYKETQNFKLIESLIPIECNFYEIKYNVIYFIKNIIIKKQIVANIYLHQNLIDKIIQHINNIYFDNYQDYCNKNVIIMKTNRNSGVFIGHNQHKCEGFLLELEKQNWINVIPEEINIYKMVIMLNNAKNIITSEGCISFLNNIFFNKNATVIYIGKNKLYIDITKKNSKSYCYINDILNDNSNKYQEYIDLINIKISKKDCCYDTVVKPCELSKILQSNSVVNIVNCNYHFYSNKIDFIQIK